MKKMERLVAINGEILNPEEAKISVFDRGFLFGDAIYEVTRSYDRIFFQMEAHIDRLYRSADKINMNLGKTKAEMIKGLYQIYEHLESDNAYMRIQISRGDGPIGMSPKLVQKTNEVVIMYPFQQIDSSYYKNGAKVYITDRLRNRKEALDPNIKSGNYLNNVLAYAEGEVHGAFETFMLNEKGHITEGTTSNLFLVSGNDLITPPSSYDILEGITRKIVMGMAKQMGMNVLEKGFDLNFLKTADEIFLTSSTREMVPVSSANGKSWDISKFSKLSEIIKKYQEVIEDYKRSH